jgi:hemolysin activation/secretion protein
MDSQISKNTLFGSEQFSVGGYYSVRGFRENYLTGDSGYYFRNKANFNIGSLILPLINKENPGYLTHLNKFKLEPFYDYGHAQTR